MQATIDFYNMQLHVMRDEHTRITFDISPEEDDNTPPESVRMLRDTTSGDTAGSFGRVTEPATAGHPVCKAQVLPVSNSVFGEYTSTYSNPLFETGDNEADAEQYMELPAYVKAAGEQFDRGGMAANNMLDIVVDGLSKEQHASKQGKVASKVKDQHGIKFSKIKASARLVTLAKVCKTPLKKVHTKQGKHAYDSLAALYSSYYMRERFKAPGGCKSWTDKCLNMRIAMHSYHAAWAEQ
jgi:hypothetical protein